MVLNYDVDGVGWEEISKWEDTDSYCTKIFSRLASKKKKKLKKLLKKDGKPRQHCLKLEVLKKRGYADGNDPGWIERNWWHKATGKKCRSEAAGTLRTEGNSKHGESDCFGYELVQVIMPNYCSPVEGEYGKFE